MSPGEENGVGGARQRDSGASELRVTVTSDGLSANPGELHVTDSFDVVLANEGGPGHVHVRAVDGLESVAAVEQTNPHVPSGETERVPVAVREGGEESSGAVVVSAGYGAREVRVPVSVSPPPEVTVDESFAHSAPPDDGDDIDAGTLAAAGLAVVGVLLAVALVLVSETLAAVVGGLAVLGGVVAVAYSLSS